MSAAVQQIAGERALVCAPTGPLIAGRSDAADLVGESFSAGAELVVIPLGRLAPEVLDLKTGLAGEILQTFVNYRRRIAIIGDLAAAAAKSRALADLMTESNRGAAVWFVRDLAALEARLASD